MSDEKQCDSAVTVELLKQKVVTFLAEREWQQFHDPRTDAMGLSIEAAELLELFLYNHAPYEALAEKREAVEDELADVLTWVLCFASTAKIDLATVLTRKLAKNALKYPIEKAKGNHKKYTDLS